jgi:beta-lactamase regulating signal transducer with metallopeptidase domain
MNPFVLSPSEGFLLELVLKGALLTAAAFALTFLFRRRSAALRHAVWSLAFLGLLFLPVGTILLPAWQVPVAGSEAAQPGEVGRPGKGSTESVTTAPSGAEHRASTDGNGAALTKESIVSGERLAARRSTWSWMRILPFVWLVGAASLLAQLAHVLGKLSHLRRVAEPVAESQWVEQAECIAEALGIHRPIQLLEHEDVAVPMTYGLRRPVIFLPAYANGWSKEQMHVTLTHELLHVKRHDHLVQVLALSARALHWFNPLTWVATKRLIVERERACDDGVLSLGVASSSYADHLVGMARHILSGREASAAALAMARPSELHARILAILDPAVPRRAPTRSRTVALTAAASILFISLAAMQPASDARSTSKGDDVVESAAEAAAPASANTTEVETQRRANHVVSELPEGVVESAAEAASPASADTTEVETQRRAIHAISELPEERSLPLLTEIARTHPNAELRAEGIFWLAQIGGDSIGELLESLARNDADPDVQKKAVFGLAELDEQAGVPHLIELAQTHPDHELRKDAIFWLGESGDDRAADVLMDIVNGR